MNTSHATGFALVLALPAIGQSGTACVTHPCDETAQHFRLVRPAGGL